MGEHPTPTASIAEQIREAAQVAICGSGSRGDWRVPPPPPSSSSRVVVATDDLQGLVEFSPNDQVVVVQAGTRIADLQRELRSQGQGLPIGHCGPTEPNLGTLGGAISMNLPHSLQGRFGSWRDWVLGMRVILADGRIARCGSKAVKNVAGYDVQKLFIGARGALGLIVEVTLRTMPLALIPDTAAVSDLDPAFLVAHRVRRADVESAAAAVAAPVVFDPEGATLWYNLPSDREPVRFPGDWVLRTGCGARNLQIEDPTIRRFMKRTKAIFDPIDKLNPGEMGV